MSSHLMPHKAALVRLNNWKSKFLSLLEWLNLYLVFGRHANAAHQSLRGIPDLTGKIIKGSSQYTIAQSNFTDIWKCTASMRPLRTLEAAVKYLRLEVRNDSHKKEITERLERDLQRTIQLNHKNLLPLLGTTQNFGELPAIVSPWMSNGSLTMLLERDFSQLTIIRKLQILNDIASALHYLHSRNVVHGNLTGNNILIDKEGNAYVADQGIHILYSELHGTSSISDNVRWAAPENFRISEDGESSSPKLSSDIYSYGCIMLQVLTGRVPYCECRSDHQVIVNIYRGNKPARPMTPHIANSLWDFIQSCWLEAECRPLAKDVLKFIQSQLELNVSNGMT